MTLKEFIHRSLQGERLPDYTIGRATSSYSSYIKKKTKIDITGYKIIIESNEVRHIKNSHGNREKEALRGQLPVTESEYLLIPEIIKSFDYVEKSAKKNNKGLDVLIFVKKIGNKYFVLEQVKDDEKTVSIQTLYIKRNLLP